MRLYIGSYGNLIRYPSIGHYPVEISEINGSSTKDSFTAWFYDINGIGLRVGDFCIDDKPISIEFTARDGLFVTPGSGRIFDGNIYPCDVLKEAEKELILFILKYRKDFVSKKTIAFYKAKGLI